MTQLIRGVILVAAFSSVSAGSDVEDFKRTLIVPALDMTQVVLAKITDANEITLVIPKFQETTRTWTRKVTQYRK